MRPLDPILEVKVLVLEAGEDIRELLADLAILGAVARELRVEYPEESIVEDVLPLVEQDLGVLNRLVRAVIAQAIE